MWGGGGERGCEGVDAGGGRWGIGGGGGEGVDGGGGVECEGVDGVWG